MKQSQLKELKQVVTDNKLSLDEIQNHMYEMITLNVLTNEEVAALLSSLFMQLLDKPHNKKQLQSIGVDSIDLDKALELMRVWTISYASKVAN